MTNRFSIVGGLLTAVFLIIVAGGLGSVGPVELLLFGPLGFVVGGFLLRHPQLS